ncbi:MAG: lipocalin family protein [Chthoniobacterales bacterium]
MKSFLLTCSLAILLCGCASQPPLKTVQHVDLKRYSGKWYEIATIPAWFEKGCHNATAVYTPLPDGRIRVINRCVTLRGKESSVTGIATVVPNSGNARLKVRFGLITGDYDIIALDTTNYRWAVVGHPSRNYLWILSRSPEMDNATYQHLLTLARENGYTLEKLRKTNQSQRTSN